MMVITESRADRVVLASSPAVESTSLVRAALSGVARSALATLLSRQLSGQSASAGEARLTPTGPALLHNYITVCYHGQEHTPRVYTNLLVSV